MSLKRPPRHGGHSVLAVPAWPLRRKVALALAIPLILAATLGGLRVRSDLGEASNSSTSAHQVDVLRPAVNYLVAAERATVAAHLDTAESQRTLSSAVSQLKTAADALARGRDSDGLNAAQRYQVDVVLDLSRALRESAAGTLSPGTWEAQLRQLQSAVTQLITTIVNAQRNPEPGLELLAQALGGRFSLAMEQALVATARNGDTGSLELFAELGAEGVAIDRLASALGDSVPEIATLRTENADRFRTVRTKGTDLGGDDAYREYDALISSLMSGIGERLTASADAARTSAMVNGAVTLGALVATILLALLISRLILNPIRRVREGTLAVAHERLPEAVARIRAGQDPGWITPIDVSTAEEIGQLARAVDDMHRQAVLLASAEARIRSQVSDMFVTLSRRNTTLVNQQLALIEALERDEQDPKRLGSLFRLDHLAARMRRTADSLLILADAPGRAAAPEALTVTDAMQAATAGVQDYQRVQITTTVDRRLEGPLAADVVHLLTELVDNALSYSPPTTTVRLSATSTAAGVAIEIEDAGLGIPDDAMAELNGTLHSGGDVTPDTARRMGLFVVSRLAQRHGMVAALRRNPSGGTTAALFLPPGVLGGEAAAPAPERIVEPAEPITPALSVPMFGAAGMEARLESLSGLPQRRPGASLAASEPLAGAATPVGEPSPPPAAPQRVESFEPRSESPAERLGRLRAKAEQAEADSTGSSEVAVPRVEVPAPHEPAPHEPAPVAPPVPVVLPAVAVEPVVTAEPIAASSRAALDGEWTDPGDEDDAPIFRALRSAWLSGGGAAEPWTSSEVEAGWDRAERVAAAAADVSPVGLPQRRPGSRLLPGGVAKTTTAIGRDPEAVRARLAAHAAGVRRGRAVAGAADDPEHERTEA